MFMEATIFEIAGGFGSTLVKGVGTKGLVKEGLKRFLHIFH